MTQVSILAFASAAFAVPHAGYHHGHGHQSLHAYGTSHSSVSAAPFPYPSGNSTGIYATTGTGAAGYSTPSISPAGITTAEETHHETVYSTIYASQPSGAAAGANGGDSCAPDVTVTSTEKVYVTVTGQSSASSSEVSAAGSAYAKPTPSSSAVPHEYGHHSIPAPGKQGSGKSIAAPASSSSAPSAPIYSAPASSSSSDAAPVATSSYADKEHHAPIAYTSESTSSSSTVAPSYASSAAASASPSSSPATSSNGKRGLAYNDASLTSCFAGSKEISWAYNWESSSDGLDGSYTFIPTLKDTSAERMDSWSANAKAAISSGSTHLFSFNEPDEASQANIDAATAAADYKTKMNPFSGQAQLCAPSVTNGGGQMGLTWLQNFLTACGGECQIDCLNIHWYDSASNTAYFKQHLQDAMALAPGKPVFVSEFGATGSDDEITAFLEDVMPWMDEQQDVAGYAYFMVQDGLLVSGTEPSSYGNTYKSYT